MKIYYSWHTYYLSGIPFGTEYGVFGLLKQILNTKRVGMKILFVSPPLNKDGKLRVCLSGKTENEINITKFGKIPELMRYPFEILLHFLSILIFKPDIIFSADPLSGIVPALLCKIGLSTKFYYINPDYYKVPKNKSITDTVYFFLDKLCTENSTKNICASSEVIKYKQHIYDFPVSKYYHFPNYPSYISVEKLKKTKKIVGRIIYVGSLSHDSNFIIMFDIIHKLHSQNPQIHLVIVGGGDRESELREYVEEHNYDEVTFMGHLTTSDTLSEIALSHFGLAIYAGKTKYDSFRDSCKIREYQALGAIPITTNVPRSNVNEIIAEKGSSGYVIDDLQQIIGIINAEISKEISQVSVKHLSKIKESYQEFYQMIGLLNV